MKSKLNLKSVFLLFALFLLFVTATGGRGNSPAFAATDDNNGEKVYSSVLDDLTKDENFNIEDYPYIENDYSLQVIQIAESADKELFIYVYQPCGTTLPLPATKVNMSLAESVDGTSLYTLTLLDQNGVFQKLKVDDLTVSADETRYYNISSIYREYNADIDTGSTSEKPIKEKSFEVGKIYEVNFTSDKLSYKCVDISTISVTDKYVGYCDYPDGFKWCQKKRCRSHYVAFSTDMPIDFLLCVKVYYSGYKVDYLTVMGETSELKFPITDTVEIKCTDFVENQADWFLGKKVKFPRIEKTSDFLADKQNNLTSSAKENLKDYSWNLRFYESLFETSGDMGTAGSASVTYLEEVSLLEMFFVTGLTYYHMGVVDDITSSDTKPSNDPEVLDTFWGWLTRQVRENIPAWVWWVIGAVLLIILLPILSLIFPVVGQVLLLLFKGLWWLITLPFRGIKALIELIQDKKNGG